MSFNVCPLVGSFILEAMTTWLEEPSPVRMGQYEF